MNGGEQQADQKLGRPLVVSMNLLPFTVTLRCQSSLLCVSSSGLKRGLDARNDGPYIVWPEMVQFPVSRDQGQFVVTCKRKRAWIVPTATDIGQK